MPLIGFEQTRAVAIWSNRGEDICLNYTTYELSIYPSFIILERNILSTVELKGVSQRTADKNERNRKSRYVECMIETVFYSLSFIRKKGERILLSN